MTKYKAGTIKVNISAHNADQLNLGHLITVHAQDVIEHEPAPEPIKNRFIVCKDGSVVSAEATNYRGADYIGDFEVTITGNDFTVEKVD